MNRFFSALAVLVFASLLQGCEGDRPEAPQQPESPAAPAPQVIAAGGEIAKACASCHGLDGVHGNSDAPFIAGQEAGYLASAMLAYTSGDRRHAAMKSAIASLDDAERTAVAAYYASLDAVWQSTSHRASPPRDDEAIAAGKDRSSACAPCHGPDGSSLRAGIPSLAGLQADYFRKALGDYLNDRRKNPLMAVFKHAMSPDDINNLTAYYSSLERRRTTLPVGGNASKGKTLAARDCAGCHGLSGMSMNPAIPSLYGHNAEYLVTAIKAYRDGERDDVTMRKAVAKLSDNAIEAIAAHYASQDPPATTVAAPDSAFDPLPAGARLSETCIGCHGENGNSVVAGIPSLSRLSTNYFIAAVEAYQSGLRDHRSMKAMVGHLGRMDIERLAFFFALREPQISPQQGQGDPARGAELAKGCGGCHGEAGNSSDAAKPSLAGQDPLYLVSAMRAYAEGRRSHKIMQGAVAKLSESDYYDIAAHYAKQQPTKPAVRMPDSPDVLAQKCDFCHGNQGRSAYPGRPRLAGQREQYLFRALRAYAASERNNSAMYAMTSILTELEMHAIANYYANLSR